MTEKLARGGSLTVEKAIDLLERVAASPEGVRNLELAREVGLDKSTSHRLLSTLERRGLLERDPHTRQYMLGSRLIEFATGAAINSTLAARSGLYELVALTGESAAFSLLVGTTYVCVDAVHAPHELRFALDLGKPYPLNAGATGKAILAFNRKAARRLLREELPGYALNTITAPRELVAQLTQVRKRGYALSDGERVAGGCSIAAPVVASDGSAFGAVAVSSVGSRLGVDALARFAPEVRKLANEYAERILR